MWFLELRNGMKGKKEKSREGEEGCLMFLISVSCLSSSTGIRDSCGVDTVR